ncbi:MAG: metallophosphoesterase [Clostridia bacterium]|nr:metallophosphoesterase [Clostridia bacterium]
MKTTFKKLLSLFLALMLLLPGALAITVSAEETENAETKASGATFATTTTYTVSKALDKTPLTFEAEIMLPDGYTQRAGVIFGNYSSNGTPAISFELAAGPKVRLYSSSSDHTFSTVIPTGEYVHIAVTVDPDAQTATLYLNGEHAETSNANSKFVAFSNVLPSNRYMVGGDLRTNSVNQQYFKGEIRNVAVYSDTRTADEISSSYTSGISASDTNLMVAYDLTKAEIKDRVQDLSVNDNDLIYSDPTYDQTELAKGLTFTSSNTYQMAKLLSYSHYPQTIEAEIFVPTSQGSRAGVIVGNFQENNWSMNLEIYEIGQPRLFFQGPNSLQVNLTFDQVDVRTGTWIHLAVTFDPSTGTATCYLDGVKKQELTTSTTIVMSSVYDSALYLGRDTRSGSSSQYFKGSIKGLALYSDLRTEAELQADMDGYDTTDESIVAAYAFTEETGRQDITENAYHFYYDGEETETPDQGGDSTGDGTEDGGETGGEAATLDGLTFASSDYAILQKTFKDNAPYTFEATILVPSTVTGRAGVILGNHNSNSYKYLSFEIYNNGVPRLCFTNPSNANDTNTYNYLFSNVHVNTGEALHLAITLDPTTGMASCYVNGELLQVITKSNFAFDNEFFENYAFVLGNDPRSIGAGGQCFKGTIGNVSVYSDTRTEEEIASDYQGINLENDNLLLYYDLSQAVSGKDIKDLTNNGYNAVYKTRGFADLKSWIIEKEPVTDYLYSFAVVGDTQIIAQNHSSQFHMIYDWILNNQKDKNIQYVFGLGDITNNNSSAEWTVASENIFRLNGVIPHSAIRGNHDGISSYNNIFVNNAAYMSQFDGFYADGDATSTYRAITVGEVDYLMVTLDYGASDDVLAWASDVIERYPDHKVIVTTHAYLYRDGTTLDQGDVCPPATNGGYNNGDHIWDELISQHENIFLVLSGHDPSANVVVAQSTGVHGNLVTQMLVDPQGVDTTTPTGMVTMLYFKADGSIEVETYSTIQELYYKEENQFVLTETQHSYTTVNSLTYLNGYTQKGAMSLTCANEECSHYTYEKTTDALIVFNGYSVNAYSNTGICVGYMINFELLNQYESMTGTEITLGLVASPYDALVNQGKPINGDGTVGDTIGGRVINYVLDDKYMHVNLILKSEDWTQYGDRNVVLCAYIIEGDTVGYICSDEITDTASSITYNSLVSTEQ